MSICLILDDLGVPHGSMQPRCHGRTAMARGSEIVRLPRRLPRGGKLQMLKRLWKQGKPGPQQHLVSDVSAIIFQYISMNHYEPLSMCQQRKAGQWWSHA